MDNVRKQARREQQSQSLDARYTEFPWWHRLACRVGQHQRVEAYTSTDEVRRWRCWCGARFWAQPKGHHVSEFQQPSVR